MHGEGLDVFFLTLKKGSPAVRKASPFSSVACCPLLSRKPFGKAVALPKAVACHSTFTGRIGMPLYLRDDAFTLKPLKAKVATIQSL